MIDAAARLRLQRRPPAGTGAARPSLVPGPVPAPVAGGFVVAWALLVLGEITGLGRLVSHHRVMDGAATPSAALALFLAGWLVMVAAMMLPVTVPALRQLGAAGATVGHFLGGFAFVWAVAGVLALSCDAFVHQVVEGVPAVASRPSIVMATLLAVAGALQLTPAVRRSLAGRAPIGSGGPLAAGRAHGLHCLLADGPVMLVMFGVGANVTAMALLTVVMVAERSARFGRLLATAVGVVLLASAVPVASGLP